MSSEAPEWSNNGRVHPDGSRPVVGPDPPPRVETLLAELSARFISLPPDGVDREIEEALRRLCELLGIELAVLWQWSGVTPDVIQPTHTYAALDKAVPKGTVKAVFEEER